MNLGENETKKEVTKMPWKDLTSLWTESNHVKGEAKFKGLDRQEKSILVEMPNAIPQNRTARLTFPCGGKLDGAPLWQRNSGVESRGTLAAFKVHETHEENWSNTSMDPHSKVRRSPRANLRLWVGFPELQRPGTVTQDLSLEGCRVNGDFRGHLGERLKLYMDLPDALAPLRIEGRVTWATSDEAGLRFINIHSQDEVRLLKTLGMAAVPASRFVPGVGIVSPAFTYRLTQKDSETTLLLSVANWDVSFTFQNAQVTGRREGAFQRFETPLSNDEISAYRTKSKISLSEAKHILCLRLFDNEDRLLLEVIGRETGFRREKRILAAIYQELSSG